jgi:hypothetical protein
MSTIIAGQSAEFTVVVKRDGAPVPIDPSSAVTARIYDASGLTQLSDPFALNASMAGANWSAGVVGVAISASVAALPAGECVLVIASTAPSLVQRFLLTVESSGEFARSTLFVKDIAVDRMRADSLVMAASGAMPSVVVTDDYIWSKLRAAEYEMAHELRVPLAPTAFFPSAPTPEQIAALNGKPWGIDPGYDYHPSDFQFNDKWGMIKLRNKPLHSVSRIRYAYPGGPTAHYDLPLDWLRVDKKYGMVQFVPSSTAFAAPLNAFVMQAIGNGRIIPLAIQISYVAGLDNVAANYPELLDAVLKKASIKILEDSFLPQSGSISADGLSQSLSVDMDKYHDAVDRIINGGKGSNGGLMTAIHGVRVGVMGG